MFHVVTEDRRLLQAEIRTQHALTELGAAITESWACYEELVSRLDGYDRLLRAVETDLRHAGYLCWDGKWEERQPASRSTDQGGRRVLRAVPEPLRPMSGFPAATA